MRKIFLTLVAVILFACQSVQAQSSPQWVKNLPAAQNSNQMIVVAWIQGTTAWISMHEKINGDWQQTMTTPGFVGKNGLGKTKEGDAKSPTGTFKFDFAMGIASDPGCAIPYVQVNEHHYWSGDANYKYNQFIDDREAPANFNKEDSEHLIDYNPHYLYALNITYNPECTPGKGSAIFMHCFGTHKPWTGGCIALPEAKMLFVMQHVRPDCVCVIDSAENLGAEL
ncbi:MAG: L,D-transpeptidase family protein [Selenomonadaceae bacterium]|nr:L,D-transpeptidase family protein [Selenomonadaceae bacterium]